MKRGTMLELYPSADALHASRERAAISPPRAELARAEDARDAQGLDVKSEDGP